MKYIISFILVSILFFLNVSYANKANDTINIALEKKIIKKIKERITHFKQFPKNTTIQVDRIIKKSEKAPYTYIDVNIFIEDELIYIFTLNDKTLEVIMEVDLR